MSVQLTLLFHINLSKKLVGWRIAEFKKYEDMPIDTPSCCIIEYSSRNSIHRMRDLRTLENLLG